MNSKNYITLTVVVASFLYSCNKSEEYSDTYRDGCLRFNAKILSGGDDTRASNESAAVYTRDTIFVDNDVYVTADVDCINSNAVATRGVPLESELQIPSLKVHVIKTGSSAWASGQNRVLEHELSMPNTSGGNFDYSPLVTFLKDGANRTFIAYSPIEGKGGVTKKSNTELTYTVPADVTQHPDLCTSNMFDNTDIKNTGSDEHIRDFKLQHELTAIGFAVRGSGVKILSATITGVQSEGTLNLDKKTWSSNGATSAVYAAKIKNQFYNVGWTESWVDCTEANGYLMMIPQTLTDAAKLTIVYQYDYGENKGKNLTLTSNLRKLTGGVWAAGKRISYNIRLKANPAVTAGDLLIDCSLAGYTTESTVNMGLIQNIPDDDVLTFTWDASWLLLRDGLPAEGTASRGVTSGWSISTNEPLNSIYFFANSNNPSTMTRTATVTVRGKKSLERTFKVTQNAKPTMSVYPTSLTLSYFKQNVKLQITTNGNLRDISLLTNELSWLKPKWNESATLPMDCDWQVNPGNRSTNVVIRLREKGRELVAEVRVPVTQNGSGRFIVLNNDEKSIRCYVNQYNFGAHFTGTLEIPHWCGKDNSRQDKTLPNENLWRTILDKYVFTGRWENNGNLGGIMRYWTNEFNFGYWKNYGENIDIDWKGKRYDFYYNKHEDTNLEYRCVTKTGNTP